MTPGVPFCLNIQSIATPELWIGPTASHGPGALPGLKESESGEYILDSEDGKRIVPSQDTSL